MPMIAEEVDGPFAPFDAKEDRGVEREEVKDAVEPSGGIDA
jgi:hypothetical protein